MKNREPLIKLSVIDVEVNELTAVTSLKMVLIHNKRLRAERDEIQAKYDEFMKDPTIRGQTRKIQALINERDYLYSLINRMKLQNLIDNDSIISAKGSGKMSDIINEKLNLKHNK